MSARSRPCLRYLIDLRNAGVAVVLISEELSELFDVTDRIAVMFKGRVMGLFETQDAGPRDGRPADGRPDEAGHRANRRGGLT